MTLRMVSVTLVPCTRNVQDHILDACRLQEHIDYQEVL